MISKTIGFRGTLFSDKPIYGQAGNESRKSLWSKATPCKINDAVENWLLTFQNMAELLEEVFW